MAALGTLGVIGAVGGLIFKACGGGSLLIQAYRNATTWRETHRTIAPAFAKGVEKIFDAGAKAITNTQAHFSGTCTKITNRSLELMTFGFFQYVISHSQPASCKDRPDTSICTAFDVIQVASTGFLAGASAYALVQMVSSSKNEKLQENSVPKKENQESQQSIAKPSARELIARQKALLNRI